MTGPGLSSVPVIRAEGPWSFTSGASWSLRSKICVRGVYQGLRNGGFSHVMPARGGRPRSLAREGVGRVVPRSRMGIR